MSQREPIDWHPGSDQQVRDLIHPSMYCYIDDTMEIKFPYRYQWLPSEFNCENGCQIKSYINGLYYDPITYECIENIFGLFKPHFEELLGLTINQCQVIVKMANIILTPDKPIYSGGSWHMEGVGHENIIASGIYYYDFKNISDSDLLFRRSLNNPVHYEQYDGSGVYYDYGIRDGAILNEQLGFIRTIEDKCIVFTNNIQHRVEQFELLDKNQCGYRKILVFFLIDPDHRILSTNDIDVQDKNQFYEFLMDHTNLGNLLPPEVIELIVNYHSPMSEAEAEENRNNLMLTRNIFDKKINEEIFENEFNLCEH